MSALNTFILVGSVLSSIASFGQDSLKIQFPEQYYNKVNDKADRFSQRTARYTAKALNELIRQEERIRKKLQKTDSAMASRLFTASSDSLKAFISNIQQRTGKLDHVSPKNYSSYLDSLNTSLAFMKHLNNVSGNIRDIEMINTSIEKVRGLNEKVEQLRHIQDYVKERQRLLYQQLSGNGLFNKELGRINKEVHYYCQAINDYKQMLSNPARLESFVVRQLQKIPQFREFFGSNSQLSSLFAAPPAGNAANVNIIGGLQTRFAVQQSIASRGYAANVNINSIVVDQAGFAKMQLDKLKDKIKSLGGLGEKEIPDFKGNTQKTKSLWKRMEFGGNLQFAKSTYLIPTTADLAVSVGYKLNDKSSIGAGLAYKAGFSIRAFNDMKFSHQGIGLRSYIDWKLKGKFYVQGGFEHNYRAQPGIPLTADVHAWQQSALLGVSRKYHISKKMNGNMQLLYDFLYKKHLLYSQPLLFRIGYSLK